MVRFGRSIKKTSSKKDPFDFAVEKQCQMQYYVNFVKS